LPNISLKAIRVFSKQVWCFQRRVTKKTSNLQTLCRCSRKYWMLSEEKNCCKAHQDFTFDSWRWFAWIWK